MTTLNRRFAPAPVPPQPRVTFGRQWAIATAIAALLVTLTDTALLQRSKSFFTGGFLSGQHLNGVGDTLLFLLASFVSDAAVSGIAAAMVMGLLARADVRARACTVAGVLAGVLPLAIADTLSYELV